MLKWRYVHLTWSVTATKRQFKAFCKELKAKEKDGYASATEWAKQELVLLPPSAHYKVRCPHFCFLVLFMFYFRLISLLCVFTMTAWQVYMEVADLAKRQNRIKHARYYYVQVRPPYLSYLSFPSLSFLFLLFLFFLSHSLPFFPLSPHQVHRMQPFASQGWLEHAKMEEEVCF